jgi:hypothetical protein
MIGVMLVGCAKKESAQSFYKRKYGIVIPSNFYEQFDNNSISSGRDGYGGDRYTAFWFNKTFLDEMPEYVADFSAEKLPPIAGTDYVNRLDKEMKWTVRSRVPILFAPDWDKEYKWKEIEIERGYLVMLYFPHSSYLIVYNSIPLGKRI